MKSWLIPLALLAAALLWRFAHGPLMPALGFAISAFTLLAAGHVGWRWRDHSRRALIVTAVTAALIIVAGLVPGLWPCDIDCAGGYPYRALFGVPIGVFGLVGLFCVVLTAARAKFTARIVAALAGGSLYLLWISWQLGMICPFCLGVHTGVLATAALALRDWRWRSLFIAALAALALHGLYHLQFARHAETEAPIAQTPNDSEQAVADAIDQGRRRGDAAAPLILELVIDFQCERCAESAPAIIQAVASNLEDRTLELIVRSMWRPRQPMNTNLERWSLAAALEGRDRHAVYVAAALGSKPGLPEETIRQRINTLIDTAHLDQVADVYKNAIGRFMRDEHDFLQANRLTSTPNARLSERASGKTLQRWNGGEPIAILTDAIRGYLTANR